MIGILSAHKVDPRKHIRYELVHGRDERGMPTQEEYPTTERHHTADKAINHNEIIAARAKTIDDKEQEKFKETRIEALERQNAELMDKLNILIEAQSGHTINSELPFALTLPQKKKVLQQRGIDTKGMSREDVEAALEE
jgi:hypothetical protein